MPTPLSQIKLLARTPRTLWIVATLLCALTYQLAEAAGLDSRRAIERAVLQIEIGDLALARSYLERPLIDPRITVTERSRAYYLQGYSLELAGHHVSAAQNYARALAFNEDNPATLAALGHLYALGLGVEKDIRQATDLLRRSAQLGHTPGMTRLGATLLAGLKQSPNPQQVLEEARIVLESATQADDGEAFLFLAQSYRRSHSPDPKPQKALELYEQALLLNEAAAFNSIGHMHLDGELGESNPEAAVSAFTRGAAAQDSSAQVSLGYLYLVGSHVDKDSTQAGNLFQQAAANGETRAHYYLGYLAETIDSPTDDHPGAELQATEHYKQAATADYPPALKRLSEIAFANAQPAEGLSYLRAYVTATLPTDSNPDPTRAAPHWQAKHLLAWILATHKQPALRDGAAALQYAQESVANNRSAASLDTLAAAYAESLDFSAAVETQNAAIALLDQTDNPQARRLDYTQRLTAYEQHLPWREAPEENAPSDATVAPK